MNDGHLSFCIDCVKSRVGEHRSKNIEKIRQYDRNRPNKEHRLEITKKNAKKYQALRDLWSKKPENKLKKYYYNLVRRAVLSGKLKKLPCEKCGTSEKVHGHHDDYNKPLDVRWLCAKHHSEHHKMLNQQKRKNETVFYL